MSQLVAEADGTPAGPLAYDAGGMAMSASIFADRPHLRAELIEDAQGAGLRVTASGSIADLIEEGPRALGDLVLIDAPVPDAACLAALSRLDLRAAHAEAQVVVLTSLDALDSVFACLDQSSPQILVAPSRAERVIALGRVLARVPRGRVQELSGEDRLALLRLTEQVAQIASKLDGFGASGSALASEEGNGSRVESPAVAFAGEGRQTARLTRALRPPLPDPRLVRRIIRHRQRRAKFFESDLFADPAWDMLLDLTAARAEHTRVSVTSLCIASGVPPTTALRWIGHMTEVGLLQRLEDETDRRRAFIALTDKASDAMARFFAELGPGTERVV